MKIVIAGTPEFSISIFEKIINDFNVVLIIAQPDRPMGRGHKMQKQPVKFLAEKYGIEILQPKNIDDTYDILKKIEFDIFVTCAYGQYITKRILELASIASINIHASLLPKYRGAAPIHHTLLNGDKETGISIIYMVQKMDAGDVIFLKKIKIEENDDFNSLSKKLSNLATMNISDWLKKIGSNNIKPIKQNEQKVTFASKIFKDDAMITANDTVNIAFNKYRAFIKYPISWIVYDNQPLKIYECFKENVPNSLEFKLLDGSIFITKFKLPNKRAITYKEYLNGKR